LTGPLICAAPHARLLHAQTNGLTQVRMATGRAIDHVVLAVRDLDGAAARYEQLGFTLTPRASHDDRMGTSNRLAQFRGRSFIELLEVDRPDKLAAHDLSRVPPFFSFGDHNRLALNEREGLSILVFASDDARADIRRFEAAGLSTFRPFDFERQARLPDGTEATVAFTLAFTQSPEMPRIAFMVSQNRAQEFFWKADYQSHPNGAQAINAVYLASMSPRRDAAFISAMFDGDVVPISGGMRVSCGPSQEVRVLSPQALMDHDPTFDGGSISPMLAGISLVSNARRDTISASDAYGMFIEWAASGG
jgi:catechol 2,3-dioxygenase-like lactoylglutathione lyase family enzyme